TGDGERGSQIVRVLEATRGSVDMEIRVAPWFDYGEVRPWIRRHGHRLFSAIGGNDGLIVWCDEPLEEDPAHELVVRLTLAAGDRRRLCLTYCSPEIIDAHQGPDEPDAAALDRELDQAVGRWRKWAETLVVASDDEPGARRSGLTLKALTYEPTGAIVAAPTTSLPEAFGAERNWDYRLCWLRDATLTLLAMMNAGIYDEAAAWRDWLHRAVAGSPGETQIMYGLRGERRLTEWEVDWLPGYADSTPVRVGNAAHHQFQLDVYGEVMDAFDQSRKGGLASTEEGWELQRALVDHV